MIANRVAREMLDVVPSIMRMLKQKWKKGPINGITESQFLMLMFIQRSPGAALQDVAQYMSLTPATTSTTVEELVSAEFVVRKTCQQDRRKVSLKITDAGEAALEKIFDDSRREIEAYLSPLSAEELSVVSSAFQLLAPLFSAEHDGA